MLYGSMLDPIVLYLGVIGICRQNSICVLFAICGFTNRIQKHIKTYRISICFFLYVSYVICQYVFCMTFPTGNSLILGNPFRGAQQP